MKTGAGLGVLGLILVFGVSLAGGASLPGAGLRGLGALLLFGTLGLFMQILWQSLTVAAPEREAAAASAAVPTAASTAAQAQRGSLLDQALPAVTPADLFQPLEPPVLTARQMEE